MAKKRRRLARERAINAARGTGSMGRFFHAAKTTSKRFISNVHRSSISHVLPWQKSGSGNSNTTRNTSAKSTSRVAAAPSESGVQSEVSFKQDEVWSVDPQRPETLGDSSLTSSSLHAHDMNTTRRASAVISDDSWKFY